MEATFPELKGRVLSFVIDTASSVNIVTPQVATEVGAQ
eukprot:CAMPEP_0182856034 /NCGR_PEP_ID=MMETSP0034_2-20130328/2200_1 /TAXON_ID=156128 /ORGANISM="Nephroselmis pyriformis, Strain CCMP717" /LENGTH=37 /DNA_ID= /DNA_START= /DNA_END= /DNA_ORIENTATION=